MNVYVVGAGAIGSFLGGALAKTGATVTFAPRHLADVVPVEADLAIVAVKAYATGEAIATLRRALPQSDAAILTPQNGIGNEEQLAEAFGTKRIVSGALTVPVERSADGTISAANKGGLALAPVGNAPHNWLLAAFERTGLPIEILADYRAMKWSKLAINVVANASCAILDVLPEKVVADPALFALEIAQLREVVAVMRALKLRTVDLPRYPVRALFAAAALPLPAARALLGRRISGARGTKPPSLLLDVRAGRGKTEIEALNGAVAAAAEDAGLAAPVNAAYAKVADAVARDASIRATYRENPSALFGSVAFERGRAAQL